MIRGGGRGQASLRHALALLTHGVLVGAVYLPVLGGSRSLRTNSPLPKGGVFVADPLAGGPITVPLERLASTSWAHLTLPIVDPFQAYGTPLLPNQGVPVYPLQLAAHLLFPTNYSIWNIVNLVALMFGSYLLASSFGQGWLGSLAVGTAAGLAGVAPPNINMAMLNPLPLLPLVLVCVRYTIDPDSRHRRQAWLGTVTTVALMGLSGFPEVLPLLAVVIVVFTGAMIVHFRVVPRRPALIASVASAGVAGTVIGVVGLLPTLSTLESGSTVNAPTSYLAHAPVVWLSTLTVPTVAGKAITAAPQDLGMTVWTLGTPLLLAVVVLALAVAVRPAGRHIRWYVWPSSALAVFGILAYVDAFHVLALLDVPLLRSVYSIRFVQFGWWIPWCLLLGAVISNVRLIRWADAAAALGTTLVFDLVLVGTYRGELQSAHLARFDGAATTATVLALVVCAAFTLAGPVAGARRTKVATVAMAGIVVASCLFYVPRDYFPAGSDEAVSSWRVPQTNAGRGDYLTFDGATPLPTTFYSVQDWGPIVPQPYGDLVNALFGPSDTADDLGSTNPSAPTLGFVDIDNRLIEILRSLGVTTVLLPTPIPVGGPSGVPPCTASRFAAVCSLGTAGSIGGRSPERFFAYRINGASPLVDRGAVPVAAASDQDALAKFVSRLSHQASALPEPAYVVGAPGDLHAARGLEGLARSANTETVSLRVSAEAGGLAVLRETYEAGLKASVNGVGTPAYPVDGGLWTAVKVGPGASHIRLDYLSTADEVEFATSAVGSTVLVAAWLGMGGTWVTRRIRRRKRVPAHRRRHRGRLSATGG